MHLEPLIRAGWRHASSRPYRPVNISIALSLKTSSSLRCLSKANVFYSRQQIRLGSSGFKNSSSHRVVDDHELSHYDAQIAEQQQKQSEAPWHREGLTDPPVRRQRSAGAMTKGKTENPILSSKLTSSQESY